MNLDKLRESGAFVSARPVLRAVTWTFKNEETGVDETLTFNVHVRRLRYAAVNNLKQDALAKLTQREYIDRLISECILLGENADESMTIDDVARLHDNLRETLIIAINDVNKLRGDAVKN